MSTLTTPPEPEAQGVSEAADPWEGLPREDRQRLGRYFSRLLLLAAQASTSDFTEETF